MQGSLSHLDSIDMVQYLPATSEGISKSKLGVGNFYIDSLEYRLIRIPKITVAYRECSKINVGGREARLGLRRVLIGDVKHVMAKWIRSEKDH
jgi:hypothetical protein